MEIRASISYYIARRAIPFMDEGDLDELQAVIEEQKAAKDLFEEERLNYKFHEVLTRRANNQVADKFIELIHWNADRYLRDALYSDPARRGQSIGEHQAILDACRAGEVDKASTLLHDHILDARKYIPDDLE